MRPLSAAARSASESGPGRSVPGWAEREADAVVVALAEALDSEAAARHASPAAESAAHATASRVVATRRSAERRGAERRAGVDIVRRKEREGRRSGTTAGTRVTRG